MNSPLTDVVPETTLPDSMTTPYDPLQHPVQLRLRRSVEERVRRVSREDRRPLVETIRILIEEALDKREKRGAAAA